jgi:hypothetical protein
MPSEICGPVCPDTGGMLFAVTGHIVPLWKRNVLPTFLKCCVLTCLYQCSNQALTEVSQVPRAKPSVQHWLGQAASTTCQAVSQALTGPSGKHHVPSRQSSTDWAKRQAPRAKPSVKHWLGQAASTTCQAVSPARAWTSWLELRARASSCA